MVESILQRVNGHDITPPSNGESPLKGAPPSPFNKMESSPLKPPPSPRKCESPLSSGSTGYVVDEHVEDDAIFEITRM